MINYLKLIRFNNLIIIFTTLVIMRYVVLKAVYGFYDLSLLYHNTGFWFLCLATISIAAGGNVINDYFDRKTDSINRPKRVLVAHKIKRRTAILNHIILSIIGVISGFIASYYMGSLKYGVFFIIIVFVLWKYSTVLKKKAFWGNFSVAALTAMIPLLVGISEYLSYKNAETPQLIYKYASAIGIANRILIGFAVFAFLYNFIRELIKDIEDYRGDKKTGMCTMAIKLGIKNAKIISGILSVITAIFVYWAWQTYLSKLPFFINEIYSSVYIWVLIIIPTIYVSIRTFAASQKKHYTGISRLLKIIMIFGVLFSFVINFMIYGNP